MCSGHCHQQDALGARWAADQQLGDRKAGLAERDGLQPQPQRHGVLGADRGLRAHPADEENKARCGEGIGGPAAC